MVAGRAQEFLKTVDAGVLESGFALLTLHRAENTDDRERFAALIGELNQLSQEIRERNERIEVPYVYLDPKTMPESIAI